MEICSEQETFRIFSIGFYLNEERGVTIVEVMPNQFQLTFNLLSDGFFINLNTELQLTLIFANKCPINQPRLMPAPKMRPFIYIDTWLHVFGKQTGDNGAKVALIIFSVAVAFSLQITMAVDNG